MYLYTGNADQAVVQYKKVIAAKSGFFQAYFNMGIAYAQENKADDALAALKQALTLAPDDTSRTQVKDLIAKLSGAPAASAPMAAQTSGSPAAAPTAGATDFHGAVEQMVRGLPVAGPMVGSVQWPDKLKAMVLMDNFPMDEMPPTAKKKFLADVKAKIDAAKKDNDVSSPVEVNFVDGASGRVMETITQ